MLRRALVIAALLAALLSAPASLRAQSPDPARLAAAHELMEVAGVAKQFNEVMPVLAQRLGEAFVAVAPDKADEIREVFKQVAVKFVDRKGELIDQIAALYAEKLSAGGHDRDRGFLQIAGRRQVHSHPAGDVAPGDDARPALGLGDRPRDRGRGAARAEKARHRVVRRVQPARKGLWPAPQLQ